MRKICQDVSVGFSRGQAGGFFDILSHYNGWLLMFLGMGSKIFLEDNISCSRRNSFATVIPTCCRFSSLVGISISDPELKFINMVLSIAIPNGLTLILQDCNNIPLAWFWLQDLWRTCTFILIVLSPNVAHLQKEIKIWGLVSPSHGPLSDCIFVSKESSNTTYGYGILIQWLFSLLINSCLEIVSRLQLNTEYDLVATV